MVSIILERSNWGECLFKIRTEGEIFQIYFVPERFELYNHSLILVTHIYSNRFIDIGLAWDQFILMFSVRQSFDNLPYHTCRLILVEREIGNLISKFYFSFEINVISFCCCQSYNLLMTLDEQIDVCILGKKLMIDFYCYIEGFVEHDLASIVELLLFNGSQLAVLHWKIRKRRQLNFLKNIDIESPWLLHLFLYILNLLRENPLILALPLFQHCFGSFTQPLGLVNNYLSLQKLEVVSCLMLMFKSLGKQYVATSNFGLYTVF